MTLGADQERDHGGLELKFSHDMFSGSRGQCLRAHVLSHFSRV